MQFGNDNKVKIFSMNTDEARAFLTFLETERIRHQGDIDDIIKLVKQVEKFYFGGEGER